MIKYTLGRIAAMMITLFVIVTISFLIIRLMPGSVYDDPDMPVAVKEALEAKLHLDKPLLVQYSYFLKGIILENDWGMSVKVQPTVPAFQVLRSKIPTSMSLNIMALFISLPLGILFGTVAALRKNKPTDHAVSVMVVVAISVPSFVFASLMQYFLSFKLGIFPIIYRPNLPNAETMRSLVLPVLALGFGPIATVTRFLRGELIETLSSEFMLLARTKGLTRVQATIRHAFRNSCVPLVNMIIGMFTGILGGSLVIERIFSIPGVGSVMMDAINSNDHPLTIASLIFYSFISLMTILIVDIMYGVVDPRIRMGAKR